MSRLTTCCLVFLVMLLSLAIFMALLIVPVALWHPQQFYSSINALIIRLEQKDPDHHHWGYRVLHKLKGLLPEDWGKKYPACDLSLQSPINFDYNHVINNSFLVPLEYVNYDARPWQDVWTVTNNGHTVKISANFSDPPAVKGGGLVPDHYIFRHFHFHWGSNDSQGSEHGINGKHYPIEVHLVHTKPDDDPSRYNVAVLGVLYEIADRSEDIDESIFSHMKLLGGAASKVLEPGSSKQISLPGFTLAHFIPPDPRYFRYYGSLTTPPCSQHLQWTVMASPLPVTKSELAKFRLLLAGHPGEQDEGRETLVDNFRPFQNIAGRVINYYSGQNNLP